VNRLELEADHVTSCDRPGVNPSTISANAPMCAGVVPQHPPTIATPCSVTKFFNDAAIDSGPSGYTVSPSCRTGSPAFG